MIENVVIVGSGPAGYTAAIYAARAGLNPLMLRGPQPGGQLSTTTIIENFPGFPNGIDAFELIQKWEAQATEFGTRIQGDIVTGIRAKRDDPNDPITLLLEGDKEIKTFSVIVATGASAKWLGIPGEDNYKNRGISSCATCDGWAFKNKDIVVIGGGDTAFEEALYLSNLCRKVYILHRRTEFRAGSIMVERAVVKENIYFILDATPMEFLGDEFKLTGVKFKYNVDEHEVELKVDGAFVAIGHTPNTSFLVNNSDTKFYIQRNGYIVKNDVTSNMLEWDYNYSGTDFIPCNGVFAAGDCADDMYRQAITAAGDGCKAAMDAERHLQSIKTKTHVS